MRTRVRPRVVVSQCLGFAPCRYDGAMISDESVRRLGDHVDFQPVCPEMAIGLGCPRDPIRVVRGGGASRLVQPSTGRDLTEAMVRFAREFLDALGEADGFLLKARSPSCGIRDVKVYAGAQDGLPVEFGRGFFAEAVMGRFGALAIEDEERLADPAAREEFLGKVSARAAARR